MLHFASHMKINSVSEDIKRKIETDRRSTVKYMEEILLEIQQKLHCLFNGLFYKVSGTFLSPLLIGFFCRVSFGDCVPCIPLLLPTQSSSCPDVSLLL